MLDSGVGGLSILREVRQQLPNEDIIYFADQAHVPYGPRSLEEIRRFTSRITRFFLNQRAKIVVVACNAASASSLHHLRASFPDLPFVGMEPAIKPAAERTSTGVVGVITTKATYQGELFASVIDRFATGVEVITQVCPEFVTLVETGQSDTPTLREVAYAYLRPLLEAGIDKLVLGCTHFPFLIPVLQEIVGPEVEIIDPSPAIARQVARVIALQRNAAENDGQTAYYTSGDPLTFRALASNLMGGGIEDSHVHCVRWQDGEVSPVAHDVGGA